jgi:hypothetical protein
VPASSKPTNWTASMLLACFPKHRPLLQKPMDRAAPAAPFAPSTGPCCNRRVANPRSIWFVPNQIAPPLKVRAKVNDRRTGVRGSRQKGWATIRQWPVGTGWSLYRIRRVPRAPMGMSAKSGGGRHSLPHCWRRRYHSGHTHPRSLSLSPRSSMARQARGMD